MVKAGAETIRAPRAEPLERALRGLMEGLEEKKNPRVLVGVLREGDEEVVGVKVEKVGVTVVIVCVECDEERRRR